MNPLTPRQIEVARLLHDGLTTAEIAAATGCSPRTVESHIFQAARRLNQPGRPLVVLVRWYARRSLLDELFHVKLSSVA